MFGLKKKKKNNLDEQNELIENQVNKSGKQDEAGQPDEKEVQPKKIDIRSYKDPEGITAKRLNFGLWYVEHRAQLRKVLNGFLIVVAFFSWTYTFYGFAYYIFKGRKQDDILAQQIVQAHVISHEHIARAGVQDLQYYPTKILKSGDKDYDIITQIRNPNKKRYAYFDYAFIVSGQEMGRARSFILPEEDKYLIFFGQEFSAKPTNAQLSIDNISWVKIDPHKISNWTSFAQEHLDIVISEEDFISAQQSELSEKLSLNQLYFKAANKTPYNYWEVKLTILLYDREGIIGINKYSIAEFMSGETKEVEMSWLGKLSKVTKIEVIPEIDILDKDNYIEFTGGIGEEK